MIKTALSRMASATPPVLEGLFAINKPPALSSADVVRKLQYTFARSPLFKEYLNGETERIKKESARQRGRRSKSKRHAQVKMGHGGTLDPLATGVLVIGIGSGTKLLPTLLGGIKEYEATAILGCSTDTYDRLGKITKRAEWKHVTREMVEKKLDLFRGEIMQLPPLYSALNMNGKRLYEYARAGEPLPKEIEARKMVVDKLELISFEEGGEHEWSLPEAEANESVKAFQGEFDKVVEEKVPQIKRGRTDSTTSTTTTTTTTIPTSPTPIPRSRSATPTTSSSTPPVLKFRMTVSSGFYVRSFIHDLGTALGSAAHMVALVRTRQSSFALGKDNTIEWEDFGIPISDYVKARHVEGAEGARIGSGEDEDGEDEDENEGDDNDERSGIRAEEYVRMKVKGKKGKDTMRPKKKPQKKPQPVRTEEELEEVRKQREEARLVWEPKLVKALESSAPSGV